MVLGGRKKAVKEKIKAETDEFQKEILFKQNDMATNSCFIFYTYDRRIETMKNMKDARYGFSSHYVYGDKFIYVIGGQF